MEPSQHWAPNDWIRVIALVGALAFFGVGSWMLFQGIVAEGVVDLKSTVLSGTIKASSAGLYICFFSLFVIAFVLASLLTQPKRKEHERPPIQSRSSRLMPVFWSLLVALGLAAGGIALLPEGARFALSIAIGTLAMALVTVVTALVRTVNED